MGELNKLISQAGSGWNSLTLEYKYLKYKYILKKSIKKYKHNIRKKKKVKGEENDGGREHFVQG